MSEKETSQVSLGARKWLLSGVVGRHRRLRSSPRWHGEIHRPI